MSFRASSKGHAFEVSAASRKACGEIFSIRALAAGMNWAYGKAQSLVTVEGTRDIRLNAAPDG